MSSPNRLPLVVGCVLVVAGFAVIAAAWYQASRQELEAGQLPYVLSGGFGGLGLVVLGAVAVLVHVVQREHHLQRDALARLATAVDRLPRVVQRRALEEIEDVPADDAAGAAPARARRARRG